MVIFTTGGGTDYCFKLEISGGSKLTIGNGNKIDETVHIKITKNSVLEIGDNNIFKSHSKIICNDNSFMKIGNKCVFGSDITLWGNVYIGDGTSVNFQCRILALDKIVIKKDCMIASLVIIRSGNQHNLYDAEIGKNLNMNDDHSHDVIIHEHVWIGQRAFILNGADIGSGSVVGANTFVNKKFPNNVCIVGNPARIARNKVMWRRESEPLYDSYEDFKEFDFTEYNT